MFLEGHLEHFVSEQNVALILVLLELSVMPIPQSRK